MTIMKKVLFGILMAVSASFATAQTAVMQQDMFDDIPLILETPDESIWAEEIALLRRFEAEK